jgi:hypothetical protein
MSLREKVAKAICKIVTLTDVTRAKPRQPIIVIYSDLGHPLLTFHPNGTVEGEIENASEAARVFVEELRGYFRQPQTDALKPASEWHSGYEAGIEAAAKALENDAKTSGNFLWSEGQWHTYQIITSARAVEIVRAIKGRGA